MTKANKPRADQYEEKLSFDGSLDDFINTSVKHAKKRYIGDVIEENG